MRYVSEQFKTLQDDLLRPQLQIRFEIGTNQCLDATHPDGAYSFDDTVAPVIHPSDCTNGYFYAVLGDPVGVDEPNRICAPDNSGDMSTPKHGVPFGITPVISANTEALIGDSTVFYHNFVGFPRLGTLCFKGVIPDTIRVEAYDFDTETWSTEATIDNSSLAEEVVFTAVADAGAFRRFWVKNSTTAGRYQLLWVMNSELQTIVFENEYVSNISVSMETDLTSQTLPEYSMTVECLDIDEEYTPDSSYWSEQFSDGKPCMLEVGYEIDGVVEYIPMMYGVLTQKPSYSEGKITFNVETKVNMSWGFDVPSIPSSSVSTGDLVVSRTFSDLIEGNQGSALFNSYNDIFASATDESNSLCNFYGELNGDESRQLVANALGGYITAGIGTVDLHSTSATQYKTYDDYLKRSEQIQCNLESQPQVGKIEISRYSYTLQGDYTDVQSASTRMDQGENGVEFKVPFYPIGRMTAMNFPSGYSIAGFDTQYANDEGGSTVNVLINKSTSGSATRSFTVRFYKVKSESCVETEIISDVGDGEAYTNDNKLITCSYVAKKVKSVAHIISDIPNQYDVDYMQDLRYELGDVIRLETQENVFKSCIITGLQYNFPGSTGHLTCRKIFSLLDCPYAVFEPDGLIIEVLSPGDIDEYIVKIAETSENGVVIGTMKIDATTSMFFTLGATKWFWTQGGESGISQVSNYLTDLNGHDWGFNFAWFENGHFDTLASVIELPDYDSGVTNDQVLFGMVNFIREIYALQGMTAPVDYTCTRRQEN